MRYFIVSDVHSFYTELKESLDKSGFDINKDTLVVNGDLFDRGEESAKVLEFIQSIPKERRILIRGNHEYLLMDLLDKTYPGRHDWSNGTVFTCYHLYTNLHPKSELARKYKGVRALENNWIALMDWKEVQAFNYVMEMILTQPMWTRMCNEIKKSGIIEWIKSDEWVDYCEIGNYIITHSFIPLISKDIDSPYLVYNSNWRTNATPKQWENATWGCPYALYDNGYFDEEKEKGKILVCGHWHSRDFHIHYEDKLNRITMTYDKDDSMYISDHLIAIDGCTVLSHKVNVLVIDGDKD